MQLSPEQFHTLFDRAAQPVLLVQDGVITQCSSRAEGLMALRLDTFVDNVRSHGLYEKMGFTNVGTYPITHADLGTVQLDMFELEL